MYVGFFYSSSDYCGAVTTDRITEMFLSLVSFFNQLFTYNSQRKLSVAYLAFLDYSVFLKLVILTPMINTTIFECVVFNN